MIDDALGAAGTNAAAVGIDKLGAGRRALSRARKCSAAARRSPASFSAPITVFIIERQFDKAGSFALAGAVLTFFGFIHGEAIGVAHRPPSRSPISPSPRCCSASPATPHVAPAVHHDLHSRGEMEPHPAE